jgi:uncharacterized membrane protein YraQ (UPF0718 family)/YHS domain-containing protein
VTGVLILAGVGWLDEIGRSLREGFFMFWETLWPLILGFTLSGAVQAFVSREALQAKLGGHGPAALARASGYGMASSSCSYAASAMAKSLFAKGADFVTAAVFMIASTNLVLELGVVLIVLIGWQFAASEFVGGFVMIALLGGLGGVFFRGRLVAAARERLTTGPAPAAEHAHEAAPTENAELQRAGWGVKLRSKGAWADAASYTIADLKMLRRELLIGFTVAGFLAVAVPEGFWNAVFLPGHGLATSVENAAVGPLIAIVSFVCSIGNVPLAAALWKGGISFGGVVSFLFADLISFPLLLVYRRYYGTRLAARMLLVFWAAMSAAGLITGEIFAAAGLVPTKRPLEVAPAHFAWDYTTYLNIAFLLIFAMLYWAYRNRGRLGADGGHVIDPVCGMQVEVTTAPASVVHDGKVFHFCSDHCAVRFEADPGRFDSRSTQANRSDGEPLDDLNTREARKQRPGEEDLGGAHTGADEDDRRPAHPGVDEHGQHFR